MKKITEPIRKSVLDVVQQNLRIAGRRTHISRIVYIGEYTGAPEDLEEYMKTIIDQLQTDYNDIQISGLFLVYPHSYVHVLEAMEDIVFKHFKAIHDNTNKKVSFGKGIILPWYHHVQQRLFAKWYHTYTMPPTLLEKPASEDLAEVQNQMSNCLTKIYSLCDFMLSKGFNSSSTMYTILQNLGEYAARLLPESTLLEYLLNVDAKVLHTIEDYVKEHSSVPFIHLYNDRIWPPPRDTMFSGVHDKKPKLSYQPILEDRKTSMQHH